jgi:hypothetical protein
MRSGGMPVAGTHSASSGDGGMHDAGRGAGATAAATATPLPPPPPRVDRDGVPRDATTAAAAAVAPRFRFKLPPFLLRSGVDAADASTAVSSAAAATPAAAGNGGSDARSAAQSTTPLAMLLWIVATQAMTPPACTSDSGSDRHRDRDQGNACAVI